MYSIMKADEKNIKKAKGVKKSVIKKQIKHEQYKETLFGTQQMWHGSEGRGHEARGMRFTACMSTKFRCPRLIQSAG